MTNNQCQIPNEWMNNSLIGHLFIGNWSLRAERGTGLSVNGKPPVSKTGTPRSSRGRPDLIRV